MYKYCLAKRKVHLYNAYLPDWRHGAYARLPSISIPGNERELFADSLLPRNVTMKAQQ